MSRARIAWAFRSRSRRSADNLTNRGLVRIAPDRVLVWNEHQKREACAVRQSGDPALAACGILVRPHPANADQWKGPNLAGIGNAALWLEPPRVHYLIARNGGLVEVAQSLGEIDDRSFSGPANQAHLQVRCAQRRPVVGSVPFVL